MNREYEDALRFEEVIAYWNSEGCGRIGPMTVREPSANTIFSFEK